MRAEPQCANGAAVSHQLGELGKPLGVLAVDARAQALTQSLREGATLLVSRGSISRHDDGANVAQIDLVDSGQRGIGLVAPLRGAQARHQLFGECHQTVGTHLGLSFGASRLVLLVDGLTHCGHAASQDLLGNEALRVRKLGQRRIAMGARRAQANDLRRERGSGTIAARRTSACTFRTRATTLTLRPRRTISARRATITIGTTCALGTRATTLTLRPRRTIGTRGPTISVGTVTTRATITVGPVTTGATIGVASAPLFDQRARYQLFVATGTDDVDAFGLGAHAFCRQNRRNAQSLEVALGVDPQDVADLGAGGKHGTVDLTFGLLGPGRAPGPRSVGARACELDVDPAGHRDPNLLPIPPKQRACPRRTGVVQPLP